MHATFIESIERPGNRSLKFIWFSVAWLLLLLIASILFRMAQPEAIYSESFEKALFHPSLRYPFGTDTSGRDLLIRCTSAFGVYWLPAIIAMVFLATFGVLLGIASEIKIIRVFVSSILNVLEGMPKYIVILLMISAFPNSNLLCIAATLGILNSSKLGKLLADRVKLLHKEEFIEAALALGISRNRLVFKHILYCYSLPIIITQTLMQISDLILIEISLAYLGAISDWGYGITVSEPNPSWGNILLIGRDHLMDGWWITLFPLAILAITISSIQVIGYDLCRRADSYGQHT